MEGFATSGDISRATGVDENKIQYAISTGGPGGGKVRESAKAGQVRLFDAECTATILSRLIEIREHKAVYRIKEGELPLSKFSFTHLKIISGLIGHASVEECTTNAQELLKVANNLARDGQRVGFILRIVRLWMTAALNIEVENK